MPGKTQTQLQVLPPFQRPLVERTESGLRALNLLLSALRGMTITDFDIAGSLALQENPTAYTISGGVINLEEGSGQNTAGRSAITVDTEGSAASDDLDTINGGRDGMLLFLRAYDDTHTVVVKHGTGNLWLEGGDYSLNSYQMTAMLVYNSTLSLWIQIGGQSRLSVSTVSSSLTATVSNEVLLCSGNMTVTLYPASGNSGRTIYIKNIGTGTITIDGNAAETIDGALTAILTVQYESVMLICDGSNWHIA